MAPIELAQHDGLAEAEEALAEEPDLALDLESGAVVICPHCGQTIPGD